MSRWDEEYKLQAYKYMINKDGEFILVSEDKMFKISELERIRSADYGWIQRFNAVNINISPKFYGHRLGIENIYCYQVCRFFI